MHLDGVCDYGPGHVLFHFSLCIKENYIYASNLHT